ncbi:FABP family protein [Mucilaginibacter boryungensis]|uniref:FABP family protein n=1 Tax=Mucilaginibacter boryungensis TaxID=768480 RepID=A0ABR9XE05_9SPHI|nr:FABP family protein [Mucilaginibacter boryungensis]MBE9665407.1 FABP family protein [Mucilaginibacter boryungensis]
MKTTFEKLKTLLIGTWKGQGFAKFPTIENTGYEEIWKFTSDEWKPTIHYEQHTWYVNATANNGQTVFWDTGFILLKDDQILLISAQSGGRLETYELVSSISNRFTFEMKSLINDPKTIRSQRIIDVNGQILLYQLNMSTHQATTFQNHLNAELKKRIGKIRY